MIAYVPAGRVATAYGVVGDAFAWLALAGLASLILLARRPGVTIGTST
jgi:hypothetical protein